MADDKGGPSPTAQSPLFKLPLELRFAIYEDVLPTTYSIDSDGRQSRIDINSKAGRSPALPQTCRIIHFESTPVFLKNKFKVVITNLDTTACDAWFAFFQPHFDTSKVNLKVQWSYPFSCPSIKHNFLQLMEAMYQRRSNVIPKAPLRSWTTAIPKPADSLWMKFGPGSDEPLFRHMKEELLIMQLRYLENSLRYAKARGRQRNDVRDELISKAVSFKIGGLEWLTEQEA